MKVRFLAPFAIFFTLWSISIAITYWLSSEGSRLQAQEKAAKSELQDVIYSQATILHGQIAKLDESVTGYTQGPGFGATTISNPTSFLGEMQQAGSWLRGRKNYLRQITNRKSQQSTLFFSLGAMPIRDQIDKARALYNDLTGAGVGNLGAVDDALTAYENMHKAFVPLTEREDAATKMDQARRVCVETLVNWPRRDGSIDQNDVPQLQKLVLLSFVLIHNDQKLIKRGFMGIEQGALSDAQAMTFDWSTVDNWTPPTTVANVDPAEVNYSYLVSDYYRRDLANRQFTTNPFYLTGATLEEIIDAQDLLIDSLLQANRLLHRRHEEVAGRAAPINARAQGDSQEIQGKTTEIRQAGETQIRDADSIGDQDASQSRNAEGYSDPDNGEFAVRVQEKLFRPLKGYKDAMEVAIQDHAADSAKLQEIFLGLRTEAKRTQYPIIHSGSDGAVIYADNDNHLYHINLGRADGLHRGMRFLVYSDAEGPNAIKGLIEVIRMPAPHFAICSLIAGSGVRGVSGSEIVEGDRIENRLYQDGRFLRVALIGDFRPPRTRFYEEELVQYLMELGVPILGHHTPQDPGLRDQIDEREVGVDVELFVLAYSPNRMQSRRRADERLFLEMNRRMPLDVVMGEDLWVYFQNQ